MIRTIVQIGNPALRQVADPVDVSQIQSDEIQVLIDDLIETMRHANGAGLAATQIAVPLRICVIEVNENPRYPYKPDIPLTVLINPKVTFLTEERVNVYEGCLSVPNIRGKVDRCPKIQIEGYDREGNNVSFISKGISAGTFQHELDHLDGFIFTDRMKDAYSLTTIEEFAAHYEDDFKVQVISIVNTFGS
ncbi:peptide deformylase [Candidatus Pseudothioglobus singularis]|jgi:peptide deformylase|nr:peptide deformylase [Candidatus Pseudothioglobus singularis]